MILAMIGTIFGLAVKSMAILAMIVILSLIFITIIARIRPVRQPQSKNSNLLIVGFFHPYCNSGGGGERVLWQCVHALHSINPNIHCVIYTGDRDATPEQILDRACQRFNVEKFDTSRLTFEFLHTRSLLADSRYPHFTMLFQSLASMIVGLESLIRFKPHIWFDTTGFAFTYPAAYLLFGCQVLTYTHYPTISTDMLTMIAEKRPSYNNDSNITNSLLKNYIKLFYYYFFTLLYSLMGQFPSIILVNSSWTFNHIQSLWFNRKRIFTLYPPCDTKSLQKLPLLKPKPLNDDNDGNSKEYRNDWIVSVGQFRPEKDHQLQIRSFHQFKQKMFKNSPHVNVNHIRLILIGGVRNENDQKRVDELKALCQSLNITDTVDFVINEPFAVLMKCLGESLVGLHTMWNEHFGMGIVEFGAAGLIILAHNSGGPKMDIVIDDDNNNVSNNNKLQRSTGFLASNESEYSDQLCSIFGELKSPKQLSLLQSIRESARDHCSEEFSDEKFMSRFHQIISPFINKSLKEKKIKTQKKIN